MKLGSDRRILRSPGAAVPSSPSLLPSSLDQRANHDDTYRYHGQYAPDPQFPLAGDGLHSNPLHNIGLIFRFPDLPSSVKARFSTKVSARLETGDN
jgi:hypothetical protein